MLAVVDVAVTLIVGYLIGSVPVAGLVAARRGLDLRDVGDRNPGYWNAKATLGRRAALPVLVGDALKGVLAALVGRLLGGADDWWLAYVGTGAAMIGHAFPVFARFRGGRSVLTWAGGAYVYAPVPAAAATAVLALTWLVSRRFDVAVRVAVVSFPVIQVVLEGPYRTAATGALMTFIGFRFAQAALAGRRTTDPATSAGG